MPDSNALCDYCRSPGCTCTASPGEHGILGHGCMCGFQSPDAVECMACGRLFDDEDVALVPLGGGEHEYVCSWCLGPGTWEADDDA